VIEEKLLKFPKGWASAQLAEISEINPKFDGQGIHEDTVVSFLPMRYVEEITGRIDLSQTKRLFEVKKGYTSFVEGDLLFAKITPCMENGKIAIAQGLRNGIGFGSTEFHVIRLYELLSQKFFFFFLVQEGIRKDAQRNMTGSAGQLRVPANFIRLLDVPLPPFPEQHRIVAKIEELFTKLDAGVEALKKLKAQLKRYRQAVLKYAFEGKLTQEWRISDKGKVQSGNDYLREISEEWLTKTKNKIKKLTALDISNLPRLPSNWIWVRLGDLAWSVKDGPHYSPPYVNQGIPFITGGNVRPTGVDFSNAKRITPELYEKLSQRCKPEKGDILYTKGGTTGIARVNTYDYEFNVWVHVAVLKLVSQVEPFYIQHALNSPFCYAQAQKFTHGVGNQDLGLTRMVNIILSLPPRDEQKEIIKRVEEHSSIHVETEKVLEQTLKQSERLRQSILKKAFEGKLVPQDPTDEPAEKLLERIKAEKAKKEAEIKRGRKRSNQMELV